MSYHRIELVRGPKGRDAHPAIKQAIRFARRLREHRIHNANFLSLFCDGEGAVVEIGRRVVRIDEDGNIKQEMRPQRTRFGYRADPQGLAAHRRRMHATYLAVAAGGRRGLGAINAGRIMVDAARFDRLYGGIV